MEHGNFVRAKNSKMIFPVEQQPVMGRIPSPIPGSSEATCEMDSDLGSSGYKHKDKQQNKCRDNFSPVPGSTKAMNDCSSASEPWHKDEIEGLNDKLLELLSLHNVSTPPKPILSQRPRTLSSTLSDTDTDNPNEAIGSRQNPMAHYKYDYAFIHHGSPMNSKNPPNWLPPIGVFWDIENCQVPKGRSAAAIAQVIRDTFFHGYREAEFIVVCDVQKENKQVMQELNNAQVNLIHVAATYKNAADEKLKQSIRRFADIHGSPACIILISSDINFAADLSDIRHRKKIHVILLHNENSSEALILCANEHFIFTELMESLPVRTPLKVPEYCDLLVSNLPKDKDLNSIKRRLKRLSDNCGGRVIGINSNVATIRFRSQDSADRAQKRMDGENVFDFNIVVKFLKEKETRSSKIQENTAPVELVSDSGTAISSPIQMYSANATITGARSLPGTPHYNSSSPVIGNFSGWNGVHCGPMNAPPGMMPPPPMFVGRSFSSNGEVIYNNRTYGEMPRVNSPVVWPAGGSQQYGRWEEQQQYKVDRGKPFGKRVPISQVRDNGAINGGGCRTPDGMRRMRGAHALMNHHHQEWNMQRPPYCPLPLPAGGYNGNGFGQPNNFKRRSPSPMYAGQMRDHQWNGHPMQLRSARTPSPYESCSVQTLNQPPNRNSPYPHSEPDNEEVEHFFNPINNRTCSGRENNTYTPVELQVTNLDQNIEPKEMKRVLSSIFMEHVMVLHVSVFMQSDGNFAANVKVPSLPDAQYAISQLHRRKVGYKRILIAYAHSGGSNPQLIRSQIVILLQEVPGHKLPLFKFREMYESRFLISVSVSDLYKMKDVCIITEDPGGRMVSLNPDHRNTPSPCLSNMSQEGHLDLPYCTIHTPKPWPDKGWAEQEMAELPNVRIPLKVLSSRVHQLLTTHNGGLPLPSLPTCYEAEFTQQLEIDEDGVPLEHLIACLPSVDLKQGVGSVKYIVWVGTKVHDDNHEESKCVSPALASQLALFSRELVDLLKTAPHCQLSFNRFIPAYHHHFGRQCRVADYGFTKLIDLLEALTHTVQVMGEGNKRTVTLSHRAQIRRFTSDLLRVLKAQASKQITLSEFPNVYARVIGKPWDVVDYGVCEIGDILNEVSENTVVVTSYNGNDKLIAIPKREQTADEIERTKQFAVEVIELLGHAPQCSMLFNKFVPSYHHHFGHQCRVSDYGFTKLIELFESIPNIVKIEDAPGGERKITLTEKEALRVLGEQIGKLVSRSRGGLSISNVAEAFLRQFGYVLRPEFFQCSSISSLLEKLSGNVKVVPSPNGPMVTLVDKSHLQQLGLQCRRILMDESNNCLPVKQFQKAYNHYYGSSCDINEIQQDLSRIVKFVGAGDEQFIELTPLQRFACNVYRVMMNYGGKMNVTQFESAYLKIIGVACKVAEYGFPTLQALLQALPCTIILQDARPKKKQLMFLNKKLAAVGIPLPSTLASPYRGRDSSNDSLESEKSSRLTAANTSGTQKEREQWKKGENAWGQNVNKVTWQTKNNDHWSIDPSTSEAQPHDWPSETGRDTLLKSLKRVPVVPKSFPPPKPDSPPEDTPNGDKTWKSSIWATPPKYNYPPDAQTHVDVPPLTLPPWNPMSPPDGSSNLLSPAKNLLPAAANPLNPRTSPYFSSKRNVVIAPHPSELPLPSMNLAPRRGNLSSDNESPSGLKELETMKFGNSLEDTSRTDSETGSTSVFAGKRRLAAQFNQRLDQ
ncbi:meiosis regulator and mRNA stability factor 1 isoform X2 [Venturia canescens]|uniref:meiosis regulator and mRNA stability factor 1 isoform X2 n=1 Tax=Venturia canescens TaxID=32260 RepID=UPI001C9C4DF0|nr:meiosis regulator and mRNA stability factor 1 isoform X2 [Venturia canescens]